MATDGAVAVVDEDLRQGFKPMPFTHPYAVKINPFFLKSPSYFTDKTHEWLLQKKVNTVLNAEKFKVILDMNIPALGARVYPDAGEWELEFVNKVLTAVWILDDVVDTTDVGKCPKAALVYLLEFHLVTMWSFPDDPFLGTQLLPFLCSFGDEEREQKLRNFEVTVAESKGQPGTVYQRELSPVGDAFRDVWADSITSMHPKSCLRLAYAVQEWLLGVLQEVEIRKALSVPGSIDEYIGIRRRTSAMRLTLVLVDGVFGLCTPDEWFNSPEMQRAVDAINDLIAWHNDIWSFKREVLQEKDVLNLVYVISHYRKVSYAAAADITIDMLNHRVADLAQAMSDLEAISPPELKENFTKYRTTSESWLSGWQDWSATCSRYA